MQCELSGIQAIAKMEGTAGIGAFPTSFLWLRSAKMAQNGAAEIGRCSSGQRGPAERRIGCAPAMILGHGCGMGWPCKGLAPPGRSSKRSRLRRLQQIKNARIWRIRSGRCAPNGWKHFVAFSEQAEGKGVFTAGGGCLGGRGLPLAPSPAARAMGGESAHSCFGRRPVGGANGACFCLPKELHGIRPLSNFAWCCHMVLSACLHCQIRRGHAMLYWLFRIDLYSLSYSGAIDTMVLQWADNLSDPERCQTLQIAALLCPLNARALTSNVYPRPWHFLPRCSFAVKFDCNGLGTNGTKKN